MYLSLHDNSAYMESHRNIFSIEKRFKPFKQVLDKTRRLTRFKQHQSLEKKRLSLKQQIIDTEKALSNLEVYLKKLLDTPMTKINLSESELKKIKKDIRFNDVRLIILKQQYQELTNLLH